MAKASKTTKIAPEQEYKKELRRIKQFMARASKRGFIWLNDPIPKQPKKITTKSVERLKRITPDTLYKKGNFIDEETGEILSGTKGRNIEKKRAAEKAKETRKAKQTNSKKKTKPKEKKGTKPKEKKDTKPKEKKETKPKPKKEPKPKSHENPTAGETEPDYGDTYIPNQSTIVLQMVRDLIDNFMPPDYWSLYWKQKKENDVSILHRILDNAINDDGEEAVARRLETVGAERINHIVTAVMYDSDGERVAYNLNEFATILNGGSLSALQADEIAYLSESAEWWEMPE